MPTNSRTRSRRSHWEIKTSDHEDAAMCNYEDHEPNLKETKPFVFEKRLRRLDWRLLHAVDLDRLIQKVDIDMLESAVETIAFGDLEMEDTCNFTEHNFCKLFRLAQLIVEYLLYTEQMLSSSVIQLRGERKQHVRQLHSQRRECKAQKEELHRLQKDIRRMKKQLRTYEIVMKLRQTEVPKPDPNQLHRCQLCEKQFESAYYLELHLKRRHGAAEDDAARMAAAGQGGTQQQQVTEMRLELNQLRAEKEQALAREAAMRDQLSQAGRAGGARLEDGACAQRDAAALVLKDSQEVEDKLEAAKGDVSKQLAIFKEHLSAKAQKLAEMENNAQYAKEMIESYETQNERLKKQLEEYQFKPQPAVVLTRPGVEEPTLHAPGLGDALEDDVDVADLMAAYAQLKKQQQDALIRYEEERSSLQDSLERATSTLQRLQDERGRLERQLAAAHKRVEELEAENIRLRNELHPQAPRTVQVGRTPAGTQAAARPGEEEQADEARRLADERAALQAERASLNDERATLQAELAALTKERKRLEADVLAHKQEVADLLNKQQSLEEQKAKLEQERQVLQEEQADLDTTIKEVEMRERDLSNAQKRQARDDKSSKQHLDEGSDTLRRAAAEEAERITSAAREEAERIVQDAKASARRDYASSAGRNSHQDVPENEQRKMSGALSDSEPQVPVADVQPKRRASMFSGFMSKKPPRPPATSASEAESDSSVSGAGKKKWSFGWRKAKTDGEAELAGNFGRGLSLSKSRSKSGRNSDGGEPGEMAIRPMPADDEVAPLPPAPTKPRPSAGSNAVDIARRASAADDSESESEIQDEIPEDIMEEGEEQGQSDSDDDRSPTKPTPVPARTGKEPPTGKPKSKNLMLEQICNHFDGDGDGFLVVKEVLQLLMQAGHASSKKAAGDMAEEMFKTKEDFLDDHDRLSFAGMQDWYKCMGHSLPQAWDAVFAGPSKTAGEDAPPQSSVLPEVEPAVEAQYSESEPEHTVLPHQHDELSAEEKEEFERRYPYAPLEDKPYVVSKHIHGRQKFEEVRKAVLPELAEKLEEMLEKFGVPENARGLSNDKYRQCMEKLEKQQKQRLNLMSPKARAREIRERKLLLRHLQDSAIDQQTQENASVPLPTSYAAAEASRSPPPVARRTAISRQSSSSSDSGSDREMAKAAPGGGSGSREWVGSWRESGGGQYGHGSSDLGAASLQEKLKQRQSLAASADPGRATLRSTDDFSDSDVDEDNEFVQAFNITPSPIPKARRGLDGLTTPASNPVGPMKSKHTTENVSDGIESFEDELTLDHTQKSSAWGGPSKDRSSIPNKEDSDEEDEVQAFMSETLDADNLDRDKHVATRGFDDADLVDQELSSMELDPGVSVGAASSYHRRISQESDISDVEEIQ